MDGGGQIENRRTNNKKKMMVEKSGRVWRNLKRDGGGIGGGGDGDGGGGGDDADDVAHDDFDDWEEDFDFKAGGVHAHTTLKP